MATRSHQIGKIEYTVEQLSKAGSDYVADVYEQTINPKTGKGWQKRRHLQRFEGKNAQTRAAFALLKRITKARNALASQTQSTGSSS